MQALMMQQRAVHPRASCREKAAYYGRGREHAAGFLWVRKLSGFGLDDGDGGDWFWEVGSVRREGIGVAAVIL